GIGIGKDARWLSALFYLADHAIQIEPFGLRDRLRFEDGRDDYLIGEREAAGERILQHVAAHGVRARLEHDPQARLRIARPQRPNRLLDGRGMMRKVVDDRDAVDFGLHLQPALHAAKRFEGLRYHSLKRRLEVK